MPKALVKTVRTEAVNAETAMMGRSASGLADRYHTLDGMRGLAALIVALYHFGEKQSWKFVPQGYLAVDFFFLLSGFVIALQYSEKLGNGLTFNRFVILRMIRLYPLHLLGLIIGAIVLFGRGWVNGAPFDFLILVPLLANALMLPSPFTILLFPFNGAQWSIFIELLINLLFARILFKTRSSALLIAVIFAAIGLALTVDLPLFFDMGWAWHNLPGGLLRALFAFPMGMLIQRMMSGKPRTKSLFATMACVALIALLFMPVPRNFQIAYEFIVVLVAFPIILIAGVRYEPFKWQAKPFGFLGDVSYAVYAIHPPLAVVSVAIAIHAGVADSVAVPIYLGTLYALATVFVRFYDAPVRAAVKMHLHVRERSIRR